MGRIFWDFEKLMSDWLIFLVILEVCFMKVFYDFDVFKSLLLIIVKGGYIGNIFFNFYLFMKIESNEFLISNVN